MSTRNVKAASAAYNSDAFMSKSHNYKAVDGRTYRAEKTLRPEATEPRHRCWKGDGFIRKAELYSIEHYLSGRGIFFGNSASVPPKEWKLLLEDINLSYDRDKGCYTSDYDMIWNYFLEKYPEKIAKESITSYGELLYRATHRR